MDLDEKGGRGQSMNVREVGRQRDTGCCWCLMSSHVNSVKHAEMFTVAFKRLARLG